MLFAQTAKLISQTYSVNSIGDTVAQETERDVFVEVKSIGLKRKIDAMATGLNITFKLILKDYAEYDGEKIVEYGGNRYNIVDVFMADDQSVELTCGLYTAG